MDNKLERMLIMQGGTQSETYGFRFSEMSPDQLISYIRDQHQAAVMELGEALDEVSWKPWAQGSWIHRDEFMNELIDVLHFWLNMALAVGGKATARELADEIFTRFALKNRTNARRQMDGYEVARRMRGTPGLENTVLVAVTGWGQEADRCRTAEAGFDHHLVKPLEPKALKSLLAKLLPNAAST